MSVLITARQQLQNPYVRLLVGCGEGLVVLGLVKNSEIRWLVAALLSAYLASVAGAAAWMLLQLFPVNVEPSHAAQGPAAIVAGAQTLQYGSFHHLGLHIDIRGGDEGLLYLALLAGVLGSFMHAAQSLAMYVGNNQLKTSWALWYVLRPWIGGILGLLFYFILRAGLIPAAGANTSDAVSPYGVVAFGALAGWFSKRATDKLAEIFETLFRTSKDNDYRDPLTRNGKPEIKSVAPAEITLATLSNETSVKLVVTCDKLAAEAWLSIDGLKQATTSEGGMKLSCLVPKANLKADHPLKLRAVNPPTPHVPGAESVMSEEFSVTVKA